MSLDVYLDSPNSHRSEAGSGIFMRQNGQTVEISRAQWEAAFPGREPVVITRDEEDRRVYSANITHNLGKMATAAGIYECLWRPEEIGINRAEQLISPLSLGLRRLEDDPSEFHKYNSPNGWGLYEHFVPFVRAYLEACKAYPEATVSVSR